MNLFVLIVGSDGVPARMFGPFDNYDSAGDKIIGLLKAEGTIITDEIRDNIDLHGVYEYDDGGGIYMILPE